MSPPPPSSRLTSLLPSTGGGLQPRSNGGSTNPKSGKSLLGLDRLAAAKRRERDEQPVGSSPSSSSSSMFARNRGSSSSSNSKKNYRRSIETPSHPGGLNREAVERTQRQARSLAHRYTKQRENNSHHRVDRDRNRDRENGDREEIHDRRRRRRRRNDDYSDDSGDDEEDLRRRRRKRNHDDYDGSSNNKSYYSDENDDFGRSMKFRSGSRDSSRAMTITGGKEIVIEIAITIALLRTSVEIGAAITKGLDTTTVRARATTLQTATTTPRAGANEGAATRAPIIGTIGGITTMTDEAAEPRAVGVHQTAMATIVLVVVVIATIASNDVPTRITAAATITTENTIATTEVVCLPRRLVFP